jgi:hypothetical protein
MSWRILTIMIGFSMLWGPVFAADPVPTMQETPSLLEQVKSGALQPVGQRIPAQPRILKRFAGGDGPGQPGGQLNMLVASARDTLLMTVYGYTRLIVYDDRFDLHVSEYVTHICLRPENDSSQCPVQVGNDKSVGKSSWPDDGNTLSVLAWIAANIFMSRRRFNLRGSGNSMAAPRWERPAYIEAIMKCRTSPGDGSFRDPCNGADQDRVELRLSGTKACPYLVP